MSDNTSSMGGEESQGIATSNGDQQASSSPFSIDDHQEKPSLIAVASEEDVDRSIFLIKGCIAVTGDGSVYVSANAFADKEKQPSLYRRCLTDDPPYSNPPRLFSPEKQFLDAVVTLRAGAIRQLSPFVADSGEGRNRVTTTYSINIKPDLSDNQHQSHAIVYAEPNYRSNSAFERIKERLARIANERIATEGWAIAPDPDFIEGQALE
jgi:hypothetical protein